MGFMESWSPSRGEGDWEDINNSGARKRKSVYFRREGLLGDITRDSEGLPQKKLRSLFLVNNGLLYLWIIVLSPSAHHGIPSLWRRQRSELGRIYNIYFIVEKEYLTYKKLENDSSSESQVSAMSLPLGTARLSW